MSTQPSRVHREPPVELPVIELTAYRAPTGEAVDPVDPRAAALIGADEARASGLLPFAIGISRLSVATEWPLRAGARELLGTMGPIHLYRVDAAELREAQDRVYGPPGGAAPGLFGQIAVARGKLSPDAVERALAEQRLHGGRVGEILAAGGAASFRDTAEIAAQQAGLPFVNLLGPAAAELAPELFDLMPENFWRTHAAVPVLRWGDTLVVAVEDARNETVADALGRECGLEIRRAVTGHRDVIAALEARYAPTYLAASRDALESLRPEDSARHLLSRGQRVTAGLLILGLAAALWFRGQTTLTVLNAASVVAFVAMVGWRMWLMRRSTEALLEVTVTPEELGALDERKLPTYSVLVPVRQEAEVLPVLVQALREIDYPKDRLDVKLLVEQDDTETLQAALSGRLPGFIEILPVPPGRPRTKPKACNYGLYHVRGEYVVIYDAEDIPEPDQLKKALVAFGKVGPEVACIQAKLSYFNRGQNLLTRWFTAEYAMWFDLLLPALHAARLPIPLGGTSNHIRAGILRSLGAWDPYNVTEDADLGVRLHKAGHRTAMIDSTTYEEANSDFINWMRQRSRWVKGYIQTWLVHMRHPARLWAELGGRGFVGFQMMIAGTPLVFLINPVYWLLTTLWFLSGWGMVPRMFPTWVYYLGMINMLFGNFAFTYMNMAAVARRGQWDLVPYTLLAPLYWGLMSVASWKALLQLFTRPSHWEKTVHGLADLSPLFAAGEGERTPRRPAAAAGGD